MKSAGSRSRFAHLAGFTLRSRLPVKGKRIYNRFTVFQNLPLTLNAIMQIIRLFRQTKNVFCMPSLFMDILICITDSLIEVSLTAAIVNYVLA